VLVTNQGFEDTYGSTSVGCPFLSKEFTVEIVDYEHIWVDGLNRGDVATADRVFAPDCVIHINGSPDPDLSVAGFKQMIGGLLAAFPDLRLTIEDQIAAGDKVATRWTAEGTNTGPLGPVAPTGRRIRTAGLILDRVAGGRVVERWEVWDQMGMLQQLGLAPA
jgi:predicted ester cyclase